MGLIHFLKCNHSKSYIWSEVHLYYWSLFYILLLERLQSCWIFRVCVGRWFYSFYDRAKSWTMQVSPYGNFPLFTSGGVCGGGDPSSWQKSLPPWEHGCACVCANVLGVYIRVIKMHGQLPQSTILDKNMQRLELSTNLAEKQADHMYKYIFQKPHFKKIVSLANFPYQVLK